MYEGNWYTEHGIEIKQLKPIYFASLEPDAILEEVEELFGKQYTALIVSRGRILVSLAQAITQKKKTYNLNVRLLITQTNI
ncbi:hypothetical protein AAFX24_28185 [Vibrio mediterranei]|uniref:hypothetical protein n=1 Tax=Vibrio mediterranei TaxID=689 RepID=UPI0038CED014